MAEMFYFSSPSDASSRLKYVRFSSRRHRPLGRRKANRTSRMGEVACMARFAEPVFCDNIFFPFSARPGSILDRDLAIGDNFGEDDDDDDNEPGGVALDEEPRSQPMLSSRYRACNDSPHELIDELDGSNSAVLAEPSDLSKCSDRSMIAAFGRPSLAVSSLGPEAVHGTLSELDLSLRLRHPRPECDEIAQEEDGRRQRLALPGDPPEGLHYFEVPSPGLPPLRQLSYQRSCDSMRSVNSVNALQQMRTSTETVTNASDNNPVDQQQAHVFSPDSLNNEGDYTILEDMAQSAWAVDDLRHQNDVLDFCNSWEASDRIAEAHGFPVSGSTRSLRKALDLQKSSGARMARNITREDTMQTGVDVQGIHWETNDLVADTRDYALQMRTLVYPTIFNTSFPDAEIRDASLQKTDTERYYRFSNFSGKQRPAFAHYQLRHLLCSSGRDVYYTTGKKVMRSSLAFPGEEHVAMDMAKSALTSLSTQVTSLATSAASYSAHQTDDILIAGGFDGEYAMLNLNASQGQTEGHVTLARNGVVTHIHMFNRRDSGLLQAAFCANDLSLRLMDIRTQRFTNTFAYDNSLNCAATSPDGRLRLLGGDSPEGLITDAGSGAVQATLRQHSDDIFACAWSPNGRFVTTGAQDGKAVVWDSRNWSAPLATLNSSMTCARSLQFTSDSAALVAAENEDVVRVYDTRDWTSKQDLRFFGTIAGVTLINGGDEIVVGNGDRNLGGLLRWQRTHGAGLNDYDCVTNETFDGNRSQAARKMQRARRRGMMRNEMVEEVFV